LERWSLKNRSGREFQKPARFGANDESDSVHRDPYGEDAKETFMKLDLRTRSLVLTPEARDEVRRRISVALARVSSWIRVIDVTITDINGPRGGVDKQCRLRIRGRSIPSVVIEHVGADALATVAAAAGRAEQVIVRKLARRRAFTPLLAY
jgi:hypothetical protein